MRGRCAQVNDHVYGEGCVAPCLITTPPSRDEHSPAFRHGCVRDQIAGAGRCVARSGARDSRRSAQSVADARRSRRQQVIVGEKALARAWSGGHRLLQKARECRHHHQAEIGGGVCMHERAQACAREERSNQNTKDDTRKSTKMRPPKSLGKLSPISNHEAQTGYRPGR